MLAKSEIALLAVSASGRPSAKRKHCSNKYRGCPMHFLNFREWYRIWPDKQNANLKTADMTVLTSRGNVSNEAAPNSGSVLWHKCSTL